MPVELERKLKRQYKARGLKGDALNRAVYGTMNKIIDKGEKEHKKSKKRVVRGTSYNVK